MIINTKDIEWIKKPLEKESEWKNYEEKFRKMLEEKFGDRSEEILEGYIGRLLKIMRKASENTGERVIGEIWKKEIHKKQESLYVAIKEEIKEKKWIGEVWKKNTQNNKEIEVDTFPLIKERNVHNRVLSLPEKLNLNIDIEATRESWKLELEEKEIEESKKMQEHLWYKIKEEVGEKSNFEEERSKVLEFKNQIKKLNNEVIAYEELMKDSLSLFDKMVKAKIIEKDNDFHLKNSQKIEIKIVELRDKIKELNNYLAINRQEQELVSKIEITPKRQK